MSNLRLFGIIVGVFTLLFTFLRYRGPKWKRSNFILLTLFSLLLILICINPDSVNFARDMLSLEEYLYGRLLSLLILFNIFIFFFTAYIKSKQGTTLIQIDKLIRHLTAADLTDNPDYHNKIKPIMILIPALNEEDNLKELLPKIPDQVNGEQVGVLVIDDGSEDQTRQVTLDQGFLVASNPVNRGGGAALRVGYDILKKSTCSICVTMDADGQHQPEEIIKLVSPIIKNQFDFVIGSRILGAREHDSTIRIAGVYLFGALISFLLGKKFSDPSSGFRAFKMDKMNTILLLEDQYHTSELIIEAVKKDISIGEAPITILKRNYGKSKKGKNFIYGLYFMKTIIKTWWRQ